MEAGIIFKIIYTPTRIGLGIILLISQTSSFFLTGLRASRGIDSKFKTLRVKVISYLFHSVGEFLKVFFDLTTGPSFFLHPTVVNVHIDIT